MVGIGVVVGIAVGITVGVVVVVVVGVGVVVAVAVGIAVGVGIAVVVVVVVGIAVVVVVVVVVAVVVAVAVMSDPLAGLVAVFRLQERTAHLAAARARHNAESYAVDLANIQYRAAEAESQHEPLATILAMGGDERERLVAAIDFVVYGKKPSVKVVG